MSITEEIARLREKHWLEVNALLGKGSHDYEGRQLRIEAIKECADAYNYLKQSKGMQDLAEEVTDIGDSIARRSGLVP